MSPSKNVFNVNRWWFGSVGESKIFCAFWVRCDAYGFLSLWFLVSLSLSLFLLSYGSHLLYQLVSCLVSSIPLYTGFKLSSSLSSSSVKKGLSILECSHCSVFSPSSDFFLSSSNGIRAVLWPFAVRSAILFGRWRMVTN